MSRTTSSVTIGQRIAERIGDRRRVADVLAGGIAVAAIRVQRQGAVLTHDGQDADCCWSQHCSVGAGHLRDGCAIGARLVDDVRRRIHAGDHIAGRNLAFRHGVGVGERHRDVVIDQNREAALRRDAPSESVAVKLNDSVMSFSRPPLT